MQLRIGLAHTKPCANQFAVYEAFREGLKMHGDEHVDIIGFDDIKKIPSCDAVAMVSYPDIVELGYKFCDEQHTQRERQFWSLINTYRGEVYKTCVQNKKRMICIDSGVINFKRGQEDHDNVYQIGYDRIKGLGNYYNVNSPPDRWLSLGKELHDFDYSGVHVVIFGQVRFGVGSQHVDIRQWYRQALNEVFAKTKTHKVVLRLHPNSQDEPFPVKNMNLKFTNNSRSLREDIEKAYCTISFSSHSIVESVLYGRPSFCCSKTSMGYPLFYIKDAGEAIEKQQQMPQKEQILQWLYDLCYTQWSVSEIKAGLCWSHLRPHALKVDDARFDDMLDQLQFV